MNLEALTNHILNKLQIDMLPANKAHEEMAASDTANSPATKIELENARKAAVLILLTPEKEHVKFPLIIRSIDGGVHSGQIALPGGRMESQDKSLKETAFRECNEEIGIPFAEINYLGELTPRFVRASNTLVSPFIGYINTQIQYKLQKSEVSSILEFSLPILLEPKTKKFSEIRVRNLILRDVPYFDVQGHRVWGATAAMLNELKLLIQN